MALRLAPTNPRSASLRAAARSKIAARERNSSNILAIGPARTPPKRTQPSQREIRDRAYFIYLARGGVNGDPVADWVRAERELREEMQAAALRGRRF